MLELKIGDKAVYPAQGVADPQEGFVPVPRAKTLVRVQRQHAEPGRFLAGGLCDHSPTPYRGA